MANVDIEKVVSPTFGAKYYVREGDNVPFGDSDVLYKCGWRYTHPEVKDEDVVHWVAVFGFISKDGKATTGICKVVTREDENGNHIPDGVYETRMSLNERWDRMFVCAVVEPYGDTTLEERVEDIYLRLKRHLKYKTIGVNDLLNAITIEFRPEDAVGWIFPGRIERDLIKWKDDLPTPHLVEVYSKDIDHDWAPLVNETNKTDNRVRGRKIDPLLVNLPIDLNFALPKHLVARFDKGEAMFKEAHVHLTLVPINDYVFKSNIFRTHESTDKQIDKLPNLDFGIYRATNNLGSGWRDYVYLVNRSNFVPCGMYSTYVRELTRYEVYAFNMKEKRKEVKDLQLDVIELTIHNAYNNGGSIGKDVQLQLELYASFKFTYETVTKYMENGEIYTTYHNRTMDLKADTDHLINSGMLVDKKEESRERAKPSVEATSEAVNNFHASWEEASKCVDEFNAEREEGYRLFERLEKRAEFVDVSKWMREASHIVMQVEGCLPPVVDDGFRCDGVYRDEDGNMKIKFTDESDYITKFELGKSDFTSFSIVMEDGANDKGDGIKVGDLGAATGIRLDAVIEMSFVYKGELRTIKREFGWLEDLDAVIGTDTEANKTQEKASSGRRSAHAEIMKKNMDKFEEMKKKHENEERLLAKKLELENEQRMIFIKSKEKDYKLKSSDFDWIANGHTINPSRYACNRFTTDFDGISTDLKILHDGFELIDIDQIETGLLILVMKHLETECIFRLNRFNLLSFYFLTGEDAWNPNNDNGVEMIDQGPQNVFEVKEPVVFKFKAIAEFSFTFDGEVKTLRRYFEWKTNSALEA